MLADSVKYKGFSCFKDDWAGFDEFKPITVIIGRNNAGKSQLLDLVEMLTNAANKNPEYPASCSGILDEEFLERIFPSNTSSGTLGGNHWADHGRKFVGIPVKWEYDKVADCCSLLDTEAFNHHAPTVKQERVNCIARNLSGINSPLAGKNFRRILADRDIINEKSTVSDRLAPNGSGATNTIQRFINSAHLPDHLIQVDLLKGLQEIFGKDGDFDRIEIRKHDAELVAQQSQKGETIYEHGELWEVFLCEPHKGLVALSNSGSGLKTVILVLLNLLLAPEMDEKQKHEYVFAFEELENNLHPSLLRRLFKYIADYVEKEKCFMFLTTHSSVALDFFSSLPASQIIHVSHNGESASAKTISTHFEQVGLINELGAKPSDLLQANGVIWLEGPSDRIYINRFIELFSDGILREGRDYQCAFYGGSILARIEFTSPEHSGGELVNLLRINNNIALICDGDRTAAQGKGSKIKKRVQRVKGEVEKIDGAYLWVTEAKEIENYIPGETWAQVYGHDGSVPDPTRYDKFPTQKLESDDYVLKNLKRRSFDKCEFASSAIHHLTREILEDRFDLNSKMEELITQINKWNE